MLISVNAMFPLVSFLSPWETLAQMSQAVSFCPSLSPCTLAVGAVSCSGGGQPTIYAVSTPPAQCGGARPWLTDREIAALQICTRLEVAMVDKCVLSIACCDC